ncbi:MAG: aldo/keto reductase [Candidatus Melainabacteria bacterium]
MPMARSTTERLSQGVPVREAGMTRVSVLTLGAAQLGLPYGRVNQTGQPSAQEAGRILTAAAAAGITHVDTARAYGDSEAVIGATLAASPLNLQPVTKLDPLETLAGDTTPQTVAAAVEHSVTASCQALALAPTAALPLLMLHRWEHRHAWDGQVWKTLKALQAAGRIAQLGASVQTPEEGLAALADPTVRAIQLPFNVLDDRWRAAGFDTAALKRPDCLIFARSVLLQGILTALPDQWPPVAGADAAALCESLQRLAGELARRSVQDLCFAYVLGQPWIHSMVVGVETEAQLQENLLLCRHTPLTPAETERVAAALQGVPRALLNPAHWPARTTQAPAEDAV